MTIQTEARNATLQDLFPMLQKQQDLKLDANVPMTAVRSVNGVLEVEGLKLFDKAHIRPTAIMDGQIAAKLGIPVKYLRELRANRIDLYDENVNRWIHGYAVESPDSDEGWTMVGADARKVLLRTFLDPDGGEGIGRALLSDTYKPIENIDVLMAALEGINASGVECQVVQANLSETRMSVRFAAPGIAALAPTLLGDYRPNADGIEEFVPGNWDAMNRLRAHYGDHLGFKPGQEPVIFAGFQIDNSETGGGAFNVRPVFTVKACKNGLMLDVAQSLRKIHLGSKLEDGVIQWSHETRQKQVELVRAQTKDAVTAFLSEDYLVGQVRSIEEKAGAKLTDAQKTIEHVAKELSYTAEEQAGILAHFISGGQMTSGGVLNAVTSYAQTVESADAAFDLESGALKALELAYAAA